MMAFTASSCREPIDDRTKPTGANGDNEEANLLSSVPSVSSCSIFMKHILRESLVHFLLLGAALFGFYAAVNKNNAASQEDIVVSAGQIEHMVTTFARTWQRPPTTEEVKGLIDQYVREEMLSREAMKLGLEQNDTVIRRRLQQKMEFIAEDLAVAEPTDADLAGYLAKHPDAFRQDQQLSFRHVYLNPGKHGEKIDAVANKLLADLKSKDAASGYVDSR